MAISILGSIFFAFIENAWGQASLIVALSHRQFTYLTIILTIFGSITINLAAKFLRANPKMRYSPKQATILLTTSLFSLLLIGGALNSYFPAGGWHPTWFTQHEITGAYWLGDNWANDSTIASDGRLNLLFRGVGPYLPSGRAFVQLNRTVIEDLSNIHHHRFNFIFVTDLMEESFMIDIASPPIQVIFRPDLDFNPNMLRIYVSYQVTIYYSDFKQST
jgi:hypothetical protein